MDFPTCPYENRKAKLQAGTYHTPLIVQEDDDEEDDDDMEDDD